MRKVIPLEKRGARGVKFESVFDSAFSKRFHK